ncbi:uncharacterized protein LOC132267698 [Cornus florida]|uniref:uncharacterized protein LOC132267698 n=1 Tax=Cornus florida TaxID=4283 RepID=UPI002897610C|nr:uncharacterized protein LOC132267698 [Cornus florida]
MGPSVVGFLLFLCWAFRLLPNGINTSSLAVPLIWSLPIPFRCFPLMVVFSDEYVLLTSFYRRTVYAGCVVVGPGETSGSCGWGFFSWVCLTGLRSNPSSGSCGWGSFFMGVL